MAPRRQNGQRVLVKPSEQTKKTTRIEDETAAKREQVQYMWSCGLPEFALRESSECHNAAFLFIC